MMAVHAPPSQMRLPLSFCVCACVCIRVYTREKGCRISCCRSDVDAFFTRAPFVRAREREAALFFLSLSHRRRLSPVQSILESKVKASVT